MSVTQASRNGSSSDGSVESCRTPPMKIYLAGPLFSPAQRGFLGECARRFRDAGVDTGMAYRGMRLCPM